MAQLNLRTRKPVERLTLADFEKFPVWEYAIDEEGVKGQDDTWVRPVDSLVVPKRSHVLVGADFATVRNKPFAGYVTVSTLDGPLEVCNVAILYNRH